MRICDQCDRGNSLNFNHKLSEIFGLKHKLSKPSRSHELPQTSILKDFSAFYNLGSKLGGRRRIMEMLVCQDFPEFQA